MANHLHLYMNNPTAGGVDGTEISSGDETLPLSIMLDASKAESKADKLAVRCDAGFSISGGTSVWFEGTNCAKWQIAPDDNYASAAEALSIGSWGSTITLSSVAATNTIFWVKASSSIAENPQNDRTVDVVAEGLVVVAGGT